MQKISIKKLVILLCGIALATGIYFLSEIYQKVVFENKKSQRIESLLNVDNSDIRSFVKNKATVVIAFDIECGHCHTEAEMIYNNLNLLKKTNIIFFSNTHKSMLDWFARIHCLDQIKNIIFLPDTSRTLTDFFQIKARPTVFVYNKDSQLMKTHEGVIIVDSLLTYLR